MENKQQTAVEWLVNKFGLAFQLGWNEEIEQAKQMEKENFVKFFVWFRDNGEKYIGMSIEQFVQQYYNETYDRATDTDQDH